MREWSARTRWIIQSGSAHLGAMLFTMTIGIFYTFGNNLPWIASFMARIVLKDNGIDSTHAASTDLTSAYDQSLSICSWIFFAFMASGSLLFGFASNLEIRLENPRIVCGIGAFFIWSGDFLTGIALYCGQEGILSSEGTFVFLYVFWGVMRGIGLGFSYLTPIQMAVRWFPNSPLLVSCIFSSIAVTAFVLDPFQGWIVNPNSDELSTEYGFTDNDRVLNRVPLMTFCTGVLVGLVQIAGIGLMKNPPDYVYGIHESAHEFIEFQGTLSPLAIRSDRPIYRRKKIMDASPTHKIVHETIPLKRASKMNLAETTQSFQELENQAKQNRSKRNLNLRDALKTRQFYHIFLIYASNLVAGLTIPLVWKVFAMSYLEITDDAFLSQSGAVSNLFTIPARFAWMGLTEFVGTRVAFTLQCGLICAVLAFSALIKDLCQGDMSCVETSFYIWVCIVIGALNGAYLWGPIMLKNTFGEKFSGVITGFILLSELPITFIGLGMFQIAGSFISWPVFMWIMAAISFVTFLAVITFSEDSGVSSEIPLDGDSKNPSENILEHRILKINLKKSQSVPIPGIYGEYGAVEMALDSN